MKPDRRPKDFFDRLSDHPIEIKPFDPSSKVGAGQYAEELNQLLANFNVSAELFGSTALEIAGKGEWEYAVWLDDRQWFPVLIHLINHYHTIHALTDDFAVFTDREMGIDIEVIPMRGEAAQRNKALMHYWLNDPAARKEYELGKIQHAFSKQAYYRWKDEYIAEIVEKL